MAVVLITPEAQQQFHALPKTVRIRMEKVFLRLENWPDVSGVKPLRGELVGRYRIRTGDYRIQFYIQPVAGEEESPDGDEVVVEKVGHRDGFYDE
jgi:mRNA-degrading endonuclease RelE of RelBE toxin-antitoxin system